MTVGALDLGSGADLRFFLEFTEADGTRRRDPLGSCVTARLEDALPVRSFQWAKGASHFPGLWWSSTTGDHVGFESWLERDHVMAMDFDPDITGIASQPFWLRRAASAAFDLGDHVFGSLLVASHYQYVSAAGGQADGRAPADPARRARNQSCLAS